MLTMDNKKFYELGLYEKSMPNTLSFREKLETVKAKIGRASCRYG